MRLFRPPGCPTIIAIVFWVGWFASLLGAFDPTAIWIGLGVCLAVTLLIWPFLSWERVYGWRSVLPVLFFLIPLPIGIFGSSNMYLPILLAALANMTFALGLGWSISSVAFAALLVGTSSTIVGLEPSAILAEILILATVCAFAIAMVHAVIQARVSRNEALVLLEQVEELTLAEERGRLARDMHDSVGHSLTAVKIAIDSAIRLEERESSSQAWEEIGHARDMTVNALADTRRWVRALRPAGLNQGLGKQAFKDLADSFRGTGVAIACLVDGEADHISQRIQLIAYRVVQESLANAIRHSGATEISISMEIDTEVHICVSDNGRGSDENILATVGGFGLRGLADRVEAVSGTFNAAPLPHRGFAVRATLPLHPRAQSIGS